MVMMSLHKRVLCVTIRVPLEMGSRSFPMNNLPEAKRKKKEREMGKKISLLNNEDI